MFAILMLTACRTKEQGQEALYLGVKDYGTEAVTKENMDHFVYQFTIDGETIDVTIDADHRYLVDLLKRNHPYLVEIEDYQLISAEELVDDSKKAKASPVSATAGERTLLNLLKTALMPMGQTLYVYGGGWNFEDTGSSIQATTIGLSSEWYQFFKEHDVQYNYQVEAPTESYFPYGGFNF